MIGRVAVVIPARDEGQLIGACLRSVLVAADGIRQPVDVVVVADGCTDSTPEIAAAFDRVRVLRTDGTNVGKARRAGVELAMLGGADWIANTDADSIVPPDWLAVQLQLADDGADVTVGTVRPDFDDLSADQRDAWHATHVPGEANGHVHGANLGVRTDAYLAVGGYRPLPEHEDTDLVSRLGVSYRVVATARGEVMTSGRQHGRTPGGYARYLRDDLLRVAAGG